MQKVKIYEVTCYEAYLMEEEGTRFSLRPWGENTRYYKGYDDGGVDYILPDGYYEAVDSLGVPYIWSTEYDYPVRIIDVDGNPAISEIKRNIILKKA